MSNATDDSPKEVVQSCRWRQFVICISSVLLAAMIVIYQAQFDVLSGLTVIPAWMWLIPGTMLLLLVRSKIGSRLWFVHFLLWITFGVWCVPETPGLFRSLYKSTDLSLKKEGHIRVISFNSGAESGWIEALKSYKPDIVLLQECGSEESLEALGQELFGENYAVEFFKNIGILCRGKKIASADYASWHYLVEYVHAAFEVEPGRIIQVSTCRLDPPVAKFDFWTREYWETHQKLRLSRRRELILTEAGIGKELKKPRVPAILGGDFNVPARDGIVKSIQPYFVDTFEVAGIGAGNTGPKQIPIHRVDQIWVTRDWEVVRCVAVPLSVSDHRMVVCDLEWPVE